MLTSKQKELIRNYHSEGKTISDIYNLTGVSREYISEYLQEVGLRLRTSQNVHNYENIARDYLVNGLTKDEIKKKYNFRGESPFYTSMNLYKDKILAESKPVENPKSTVSNNDLIYVENSIRKVLDEKVEEIKKESAKLVPSPRLSLKSLGYYLLDDGTWELLDYKGTPSRRVKVENNMVFITRYIKSKEIWGNPISIEFNELEALYDECLALGLHSFER